MHRNITPCTQIPPHIHHNNTTRTTYPSRIPQLCLTCSARIDLGDVSPTRVATGPTRGAIIGVHLPVALEAAVPDLERRDVKGVSLSLAATRRTMIGVHLPAALEATIPALARRDVEGVPQSLTATRGRCRLRLPFHLVVPGSLRAAETLVSIPRRSAGVCRQHRNIARLWRASL